MARTPKTATDKKHPMNTLRKDKHVYGIVFALLKPNIVFKTTKWWPNAKCWIQIFICLPTCLITYERLQVDEATNGHQTLPQSHTHQSNVLFQVPKFVCPLHLVLSLILRIMIIFFVQQSYSEVLICRTNTFHIRRHKIILGSLIFQVKH